MTSFEHFMEDCMTRDWAANKRQLFGLIAPYSGAADAAATSRWPSAAGALFRSKRQQASVYDLRFTFVTKGAQV